MPTLRKIDPYMDGVQALLEQSDQYLITLYPPESNHLEYAEDMAKENVFFLGVFEDAELIGCGAVKIMEDDGHYGEVKRVFVIPEARGKGIASLIMQELEQHLATMQVPFVRLEVGPKQPEAISLYKKLGYKDRGPFGSYRNDPLSIFMEKQIII